MRVAGPTRGRGERTNCGTFTPEEVRHLFWSVKLYGGAERQLMTIGSFARNGDGHAFNRTEAIDEWLPIAGEVLAGVARTPYGVITYKELGDAVQSRTGVRTAQLLQNWVGPFTRTLAQAHHATEQPPLTALVVRKEDGMVGEGYDEVMRLEGVVPATDAWQREDHAAAARLRCYQWAGAPEPAQGWQPRVATGTRRRSEPHSRAGASSRPRTVEPQVVMTFCPCCFIEVPVSGHCDNCD